MPKISVFILYLFYFLTIGVTLFLLYTGYSYYNLPLIDRPHHPGYESWKPGGLYGHGLGIAGALLLISLLAYILRKRVKFMQNWGDLSTWLNFHIWMGITGPILIIFHTTFKFGGIVSISFWSMVAVALSGVLGRYLYLQIPRSKNGTEINRLELEDSNRAQVTILREKTKFGDELLELINEISSTNKINQANSWRTLPELIIADLKSIFIKKQIRKILEEDNHLSKTEINNIINIAVAHYRMEHRLIFLSAAQKMLHHWHVIHKPFAAIMYLFMIIHIVVAVLFGYLWIF